MEHRHTETLQPEMYCRNKKKSFVLRRILKVHSIYSLAGKMLNVYQYDLHVFMYNPILMSC